MNSLIILISLLVAGGMGNSYKMTRRSLPVRVMNYGNPAFIPSSYPVVVSSSYYTSSPSSSYGYSSGEGNSIITSYTRNINPTNSDRTSFTTSNGISQSHNVQVVRGHPIMNGHSYHTSPEGQQISLTWSADQNGFNAQGDHLPKPVALPAEHAAAHQQANLIASQSSGFHGSSNTAPVSNGYGNGFNTPVVSVSNGFGGSSSSPISNNQGPTISAPVVSVVSRPSGQNRPVPTNYGSNAPASVISVVSRPVSQNRPVSNNYGGSPSAPVISVVSHPVSQNRPISSGYSSSVSSPAASVSQGYGQSNSASFSNGYRSNSFSSPIRNRPQSQSIRFSSYSQ